MKLMKVKAALSVSALALTAIAMPALAQEAEEQPEGEANKICHDDAGEVVTCAVIGIAGAYALNEVAEMAVESLGDTSKNINRQIANNYANREIAKTAATGQGTRTNYQLLKDPEAVMRDPTGQAETAARAADNAEMNTLNQRGEVAQRARANAVAGSADDVAKLDVRGQLSQQIRARKAVVPTGTAPVATPEVMGNRAQAARANVIAGSADDLARLEARGTAAQAPRANAVGGAADDLARLEARGNAAQGARATSVAGSADDLARLEARGNAAQGSRAGTVSGTADGLARLEANGNRVQNSRLQARNVNAAGRAGPVFDRALQTKIGPEGTSRLIAQGDATQMARGRIVNEGQLVRNINNAGGDITRLNQAGRSAQVRHTSGIPRGAPRVGAVAGSADDLAKIASTGAKVGRAGKAGRAVLAASGAGAVAVAAEIAATESVKALTGAEIQDPFSTGFQYGAAIFDKDVTIGDVMAARREHHRENFRALGDTLTTEGKWVENLENYADSKNPALGNIVRGVDQFDRKKRELLKNATGIEAERMTDVGSRYLGALREERKLKALGDVAMSRAQHHFSNAGNVLRKTRDTSRAIGSSTRQGLGTATGMELRSVRDTQQRYADALKGPDKLKNLGQVAGDRAKHHWDNTKKVGSKIGCGISNIFRKKENDKDC